MVAEAAEQERKCRQVNRENADRWIFLVSKLSRLLFFVSRLVIDRNGKTQ